MDDNSPDEMAQVVAGFDDPQVRYVKNDPNLKLPLALNRGFSLARGDYLTWTSDDNPLAPTATGTGASRWGLKEVHLDVQHTRYLKWVYPNARFVFLYRNPLEAYRSYCRYGRSWYDLFPHCPVFTPTAFGTHWRRLMEGYLEGAEALCSMLLKYENLIGPTPPLAQLDAYLCIQTGHGVLAKKVGSSEREGNKVQVNRLARYLLKRAVGPVAARLGYVI